ncbi:winged helix-turn-helix transcriptional regulator [Roseiterribacter gracilis]|uniref:Putative HTH-type transcriptional regulator YdeP n=1 Tax=Roseiterribacter gracilis TaxID=2812848 RepID=A0A8S8XBC7_9PROT|nr:putative HTH-type transcriptional regulator YdeP [Rhodospirillales bacterium TMPK1]
MGTVPVPQGAPPNWAACPVEITLDVIGGRWKGVILYHLMNRTLRFNALRRALPNITQRMLTLQLRELERDGLVRRTVYAEVPPKVEYDLTEHGRSLTPLLHAMHDWGMQWVATRGVEPGSEGSAAA